VEQQRSFALPGRATLIAVAIVALFLGRTR
jgi:hypothetical protein